MIHDAPSDITAVTSMLVLIFVCSGQERKTAHSDFRKIMERTSYLFFIIVSVIAISER